MSKKPTSKAQPAKQGQFTPKFGRVQFNGRNFYVSEAPNPATQLGPWCIIENNGNGKMPIVIRDGISGSRKNAERVLAKEVEAIAKSKDRHPVELEAPFNYSHPSSRCPKHISPISKRQLFHSFKTTERFVIRSGVYGTKMVCKHCGGFIKGVEDYTVTAALFSR